MNPWRPQPRAMDDDARLLLLGPEAQAVAWRLSGRVVGGRVPVGSDPVAATVAICGGASWAVLGLSDLERASLVTREPGALVLAWEWPALETAQSSRTAPSAAPDDARVRATDSRAVERRLRALWSRYGVDTPEARVAWIDSPAGLRFLEREQRDRAWALPFTRTAGDNRGRFGCRRAVTTPGDNSADNSGDNHGDNSTPPPTPPTPEKNKKSSGEAPVRGGNNSGDNHGDNSEASAGRRQPTATTDNRDNSAPRCPTVERLTSAPSAAEVFMHLRGDGKLRLSISTAHEAELARTLEGVTPAWALEGVKRLAHHVEGHLRNGWKPKLDDLRGRDGTWARLLTLYDEAQGCPRCVKPVQAPKRPDARAPHRPTAPLATAADTRRLHPTRQPDPET